MNLAQSSNLQSKRPTTCSFPAHTYLGGFESLRAALHGLTPQNQPSRFFREIHESVLSMVRSLLSSIYDEISNQLTEKIKALDSYKAIKRIIKKSGGDDEFRSRRCSQTTDSTESVDSSIFPINFSDQTSQSRPITQRIYSVESQYPDANEALSLLMKDINEIAERLGSNFSRESKVYVKLRSLILTQVNSNLESLDFGNVADRGRFRKEECLEKMSSCMVPIFRANGYHHVAKIDYMNRTRKLSEASFYEDITQGDCAYVQIRNGVFFLGNRRSLIVRGDPTFSKVVLSEMKNMRFHHALTAIGSEEGLPPNYGTNKKSIRGGAVVVGGTNGRTYLKIAELLDFKTDKWRDITPLKEGRALHCCCTLGARTVITLGGSNGERGVEANTVEILEVGKSKGWKQLYLTQKRESFWEGRTNLKAVGMENNQIFIFGSTPENTLFTASLKLPDNSDGKVEVEDEVQDTRRRGDFGSLSTVRLNLQNYPSKAIAGVFDEQERFWVLGKKGVWSVFEIFI